MKAKLCLLVLLLPVSLPALADGSGSSCARWARDIVRGEAESCDELCPQARKFDHYDYRAGLASAFESKRGLGRFLAYVGRSSIIGSAAEAHACAVHALILHWGDEAFSRSLSRQSREAREQAVGLLDYSALDAFEARYPRTYALASHD